MTRMQSVIIMESITIMKAEAAESMDAEAIAVEITNILQNKFKK